MLCSRSAYSQVMGTGSACGAGAFLTEHPCMTSTRILHNIPGFFCRKRPDSGGALCALLAGARSAMLPPPTHEFPSSRSLANGPSWLQGCVCTNWRIRTAPSEFPFLQVENPAPKPAPLSPACGRDGSSAGEKFWDLSLQRRGIFNEKSY